MIAQKLEDCVRSVLRYHPDIRRTFSEEIGPGYDPKKAKNQAKVVTGIIRNISDDMPLLKLARNIGSLPKPKPVHYGLATMILKEREKRNIKLGKKNREIIMDYALKPDEEKSVEDQEKESQDMRTLIQRIRTDEKVNEKDLAVCCNELGHLYRNYSNYMLMKRERSLNKIILALEESLFYFYLSKTFKHETRKSRIQREEIQERLQLLKKLNRAKKIRGAFDRYDYIDDMLEDSAGLSGAVFVYNISMLKRCLGQISKNKEEKKYKKDEYKKNFKAVEEAKEEMDLLIGSDGHYSDEEWDRLTRMGAIRYMKRDGFINDDKRIFRAQNLFREIMSLDINRSKKLEGPPHEEIKEITIKIIEDIYENFLPKSIKRKRKTREAMEMIFWILSNPVVFDMDQKNWNVDEIERAKPYLGIMEEYKKLIESKLEPYQVVIPIVMGKNEKKLNEQEIEEELNKYEENNKLNHVLFDRLFKQNPWLKKEGKRKARNARYKIFHTLRKAAEYKIKRNKKAYESQMRELRQYSEYAAIIPVYVAIKIGTLDVAAIYSAAKLKWETRQKFQILKKAGLY